MIERLQKVIAHSGFYSRRQAEELISKGEVWVNGKKVTQLGTKVDPLTAHIKVKGKLVTRPQKKSYYLFYKPRKSVVTRNDPEERLTVYDFIPKKLHFLKPVGRLDFDSEGLMILTNDGDFANQITHPRYHLEKVYRVKISCHPAEHQLERLRKGVVLDDRMTLPAKIEVLKENKQTVWLEVTLKEGRNRQIRRMCEVVGLTVKSLIRVQIGPYKVGELKPGELLAVKPFSV